MGRRRRIAVEYEDEPPRLREGMTPPPPWEIRFRRLEKYALRVCGFRCRSHRLLPDDDAQEARQQAADAAAGAEAGEGLQGTPQSV
jgi:hypothetical protein